jgi:hypothetical protein
MGGETVVYARKLERSRHGVTPTGEIHVRMGDTRWPRSRRLAFVAGAAALCWAVPVLVAYLLAGA